MLLDQTKFLVKERVAVLKLSDTYDIYDPASGSQIGIAQEKPSTLVHVLRFFINKRMLPTTVEVREAADRPIVFSIQRGLTLLRSRVMVLDAQGAAVGYLRSKLVSLGGGFFVHDAADNQVAEVKGDWKGWNFQLLGSDGRTMGTITKKWAGIGKELFTSADNYMIALNEEFARDRRVLTLLLAAGLAIDIVYKEK